jgi:hypothetical protein
MWRGTVVALAIVGGGCLTAPAVERGTPLYTAGPAPLPPSQVAILEARAPQDVMWIGTGSRPHIKSVDGRDVTPWSAPFELLPGCHVVETAGPGVVAKRTNYTEGAWGCVFALRMSGGSVYTVLFDYLQPPYVSVRAVAWDPVRRESHEVRAATGEADVQACRAWTPSSS